MWEAETSLVAVVFAPASVTEARLAMVSISLSMVLSTLVAEIAQTLKKHPQVGFGWNLKVAALLNAHGAMYSAQRCALSYGTSTST